MAGFQYYCRKLSLFNTSRLINKNGILLQSKRGRHHLVFQMSSQSTTVLQKSKSLFNANTGRKFTFRLASTNVPISKEKTSETDHSVVVDTQNNSDKLISDAEVAQSSNSNVIIDESALPPAPQADVTEIPVMEFVSTGLSEPSFESLGLGSWWPPGIVQQILEYIHINLGLPWWQAIIIVTLVSRFFLLPVNLTARKDSINLMNHFPKITEFQEKITAARMSGDFYAAATHTQELQTFMQEKNVKMFSFFKTALIQFPVFISMYAGLKGMANCPVESMKTEGMFWFQDLTIPDPYYILPAILSTSLLAIIEVGAEGNPAKANTHAVKWIMRGIPLLIFGISTQFSACITYYWTISNSIALIQVGVLKIPAVASFFGLPKVIKHDMHKKRTQKGFIEGFKEGIENAKITSQIEDRNRVNLLEFQRAGTGAVPRTFKKNPLLQKEKKLT